MLLSVATVAAFLPLLVSSLGKVGAVRRSIGEVGAVRLALALLGLLRTTMRSVVGNWGLGTTLGLIASLLVPHGAFRSLRPAMFLGNAVPVIALRTVLTREASLRPLWPHVFQGDVVPVVVLRTEASLWSLMIQWDLTPVIVLRTVLTGEADWATVELRIVPVAVGVRSMNSSIVTLLLGVIVVAMVLIAKSISLGRERGSLGDREKRQGRRK